MARYYYNRSYLDYNSYFSMPLHLAFFIFILVFVLSLSWYKNYESKFEDLINQVKLFLMLSPILMLLVFHLLSGGKYNGSTITVLGRNTVFSEVREMPVIGGSGLFRFARGYVQARTHTFDANTGDAIVEYDIYVLHY